MLDLTQLAKTLDAIRSASALTETKFLHLGQTLEASIQILSNLAAGFEAAMTELRGETLRRSIAALAVAADRVAQLGRGQSEASARFNQLQRAAEAIAGRIAKLDRPVKAIGSIVINAKIAATAIRSTEIDSATFAIEIGRAMAAAAKILDSFGAELGALRETVASAYAAELAFEKHQQEAVRSIPERLNATVAAIPLRHRRAAQSISAVHQRGESVREQVGAAVVALQAGDITRQRLEHADLALALLTGRMEPRAGQPRLQPFACNELNEPAGSAFATTTCRLQSAQLSDAADGFERDIRQIAAALDNLAAEARALHDLSVSAYGATGRDHGTFIMELEAQVGEALALFSEFGRSRAAAASVMASVTGGSVILCDRLLAVRSLEEDIRILGLNTTLKCSRIGPEGRALGLIAQELRSYGDAFAKQAESLMQDVENLVQITRSIGSREADAGLVIAAVIQQVNDALDALRRVGQTLNGTLSALERDSERVVSLLEDTVAGLAGHDGVGLALREAAKTLGDMAPNGDVPLADLTPRARQMLDVMAGFYTMTNERMVHDRVLGRPGPVQAAAAGGGTTELEDILF